MSTKPEPGAGAIPGRPWLLASGRNFVLERLDRREPVVTLGVRAARTIDIAKTAQATGHHLLWVDLEHSAMSIDTAAQICSACLDVGLVPMFRPPEKDYGVIGRMLDGGALGVMVARVETPEEAAEIVAACRFPPLGRRSQIVGLPLFGMRRLPAREHNDLANRATLVKVLIESERGIRNVEKIAAVPGVDLVGIGSNDFTAELGLHGDYRHEKVFAAYKAGIEACRKHGKHFIVGGVADLKYQRELWDAGAGMMIQSAIDSELMRDALQEKVSAIAAASL
jgi:2-keto-3-deoxy-L-rhamnonate aldolase RhmA